MVYDVHTRLTDRGPMRVDAALTNMPYFLLQHTILWPPILWAAVFTAITLYQISRIYLGRQPVEVERLTRLLRSPDL